MVMLTEQSKQLELWAQAVQAGKMELMVGVSQDAECSVDG
jgi:hypothetical protein